MLRKENNSILSRQHILSEHAVHISAQRRLRFLRRQRPIQPPLHEDAADTVAHPHSTDAIPDCNNLAGSV
jgi:hypothetical protein